jgi:hypothetical protein
MSGSALTEAREQCHHAVQINTRLARGFTQEQADDSHTSLSWNASAGALIGQPAGGFRLGIRIADLTLVLYGAEGGEPSSFALDGRTLDDAMTWLEGRLVEAGLDPSPLRKPLHFTLEPHALQEGGTFRQKGIETELAELAKWYGDAALCLGKVSSPVRCWPHHFDLATQVTVEKGSIGAGMSPGDASYAQPYFYLSPWPYPAAEELPPLELGHWHTAGWVGAVLTADEVIAAADQQQAVSLFLNQLHPNA